MINQAALLLTATPFQLILGSLSEQLKGGKAKPEYIKAFKPLSNVVFLCQSKFKAVSNRLHSVMAGLLGNSKELPFLDTVFCRLFQSCHLCTANHSGGLNPHKSRNTAMNTPISGETTPQFQQLIFELESIETLSLQSNNLTCSNPRKVLADIFQHSQKALNVLHEISGNKKPA